MDTRVDGHQLAERLMRNDKAKLMARLLSSLSALRSKPPFALCEGGALHGVYLHRRWNEDLDFQVRRSELPEFRTCLQALGCVEETQGDDTQTKSNTVPLVFIFQAPGTIFPHSALRVDVWVRDEWLVEPEPRAYTSRTGETCSIPALSLSELVAYKISYLDRWHGPVPLFDVWTALDAHPEITEHVRGVIYAPAWESEGYGAKRRVHTSKILQNLSGAGEAWHETLRLCVPTFPPFEKVRGDLEAWLPLYA